MLRVFRPRDWVCIGEWETPFLLDTMSILSAAPENSEGQGIPFGYDGQLILGKRNYLSRKECDLIQEYLVQNSTPEKFEELKKKSVRFAKDILLFSEGVRKMDFSRCSDAELLELHKKYVTLFFPCAGFSYRLQPFDDVLSLILREKLKKYLTSSGEDFSVILQRLAIPLRKASVAEEREELLELAAKHTVSKVNSLRSDLTKHQSRFGWMNNFLWLSQEYSVEHYEEELRKVRKTAKKYLDGLKSKREEQKRLHEETLAKIETSGIKIRTFILWIREFINIKMESWEAIARSGNNLHGLWTELGRRRGLTYKEFMYLSNDELVSGKSVAKEVLQKRIMLKGLERVKGETRELSQEEVRVFTEKLVGSSRETETCGQPTYPGIIESVARVCITAEETRKIRKGDILVCPMTNPDYMVGARRAGAIVTDHGGILCHAAIISRELHIPCVIGTKNATLLFKDGDKLLVDAKKGIVKKL